jgi:cytidylate kinase
MIIAIDGPAGAGKSTVAKLVAKSLNFLYIDTGAMYRALTLKALEQGVDIKDPRKVTELASHTEISLFNDPQVPLKVLLDGRDVTLDIRQPRITRFVSEVAKIKEVRQIMVELQRKLGNQGNAVLDGRDIGTVVFPNAERKFYIDADFRERVKRRHKEANGLGQALTIEDVAADLANRDRIDSGRAVAPLRQAEDAIYVDTTKLNIGEVVNKVLGLING